MKVLFINSVCGIRSTGRICAQKADEFAAQGHEVKIAYGREDEVPEEYRKYAVRIGNMLDVKLHGVCTRLFDSHGFGSRRATKKFLAWAEEFKPDVLWLHNIHGYYINVEMLFGWIKMHPEMKVMWTLHDCWAFTGHCTYFSYAKCDKWSECCQSCPQKASYPQSIFLDNSRRNYIRKKDAFTGVKDMTIITPSKWMAELVHRSFLKEYPVEVVYNTIDRTVFKPTPSDFRQRYGLENKKIILGVASVWEPRKGLGDFKELAQRLDDQYAIVLVGVTGEQSKKMPANILCIPRTNNASELAEIYTTADVFVNPSVEETFGLTVLEALSCGTKTIVYEGTACEEVSRKFGGNIVQRGTDSLIEAISLVWK